VNYRGSAGYGEKFRELNVKNLGVGDAWDVQSGVESLVAKGWVDPSKVGCMGWSQGGYISAFLTTSTTLCAAVSVGAGISNWATYYYNTDITPFTIQYLGANPAEDPAIYQKTSPMTYIKQAKTPTLIQHGENDRRVPIPNGYELRQGLEDRGVPVEMVVYKGFGHGITKPKSQRAVMTHNLLWFNHYIWGIRRLISLHASGSFGYRCCRLVRRARSAEADARPDSALSAAILLAFCLAGCGGGVGGVGSTPPLGQASRASLSPGECFGRGRRDAAVRRRRFRR
jgi:predicted esterase